MKQVAKYVKLGKYLSYYTRQSAITSTCIEILWNKWYIFEEIEIEEYRERQELQLFLLQEIFLVHLDDGMALNIPCKIISCAKSDFAHIS